VTPVLVRGRRHQGCGGVRFGGYVIGSARTPREVETRDAGAEFVTSRGHACHSQGWSPGRGVMG
jgi:hypothetical protein